MTSTAPNPSAKNAAQSAHRIDLLIHGQNRQFLTVSSDKNLGPNRPPSNGGLYKPQNPKNSNRPTAILRPLHRCAKAGDNTFRKGISARAPSC